MNVDWNTILYKNIYVCNIIPNCYYHDGNDNQNQCFMLFVAYVWISWEA